MRRGIAAIAAHTARLHAFTALAGFVVTGAGLVFGHAQGLRYHSQMDFLSKVFTFVAIWQGVAIASAERRLRTDRLLLAQPIARGGLVAGQACGLGILTLCVWVPACLVFLAHGATDGAGTLGVLLLGGALGWLAGVGAGTLAFSLALLLPRGVAMMTVGAARLAYPAIISGAAMESLPLRGLAWVAQLLLPPFGKLDLFRNMYLGEWPPMVATALVVLDTVGYCAVVLWLASAMYRRADV